METADLVGLYETRMARKTLAGRYLSGHEALFPATAEAWRDLVERSETLYDMAMSLRADDTFEAPEPLRERATAGAEAIAERIVRVARLETHRAMGEREKADATVKALLEG